MNHWTPYDAGFTRHDYSEWDADRDFDDEADDVPRYDPDAERSAAEAVERIVERQWSAVTPKQLILNLRKTASLSLVEFARLLGLDPQSHHTRNVYVEFRASVNFLSKFDEQNWERVCGACGSPTGHRPAEDGDTEDGTAPLGGSIGGAA